jgi:hypothetical protein
MKIFPFGEGRTDKDIFDFLLEKCPPDVRFEDFYYVNGKDRFYNKIKIIVKTDLDSKADDICILVFCDIDKGCKQEDVVNKFYTIFKKLMPEWDGKPMKHTAFGNIYLFEHASCEERPGLRLVLHLADISGFELPEKIKKSNNTTDGYVLAAGLDKIVLNKFALKDAKTTEDKLRDLITECISSCFSNAGIIFEQDKDFLAAYLCASRFWVQHRTENARNLTQVIMSRSWKYNPKYFRDIFATWIEAMTEAGGPTR